jgi:hypothetical protein
MYYQKPVATLRVVWVNGLVKSGQMLKQGNLVEDKKVTVGTTLLVGQKQ